MSEKGDVIGKRYKIQTKNRSGEWVDFGPFYFRTLESTKVYLGEYESLLKKARIVEVTETVLEYAD